MQDGLHPVTLRVKGGRPTAEQAAQLQKYFESMPVEDILAGLKFAGSRRAASEAGVLRVGRKSIIRREVHSVTAEQARWRLDNWKMMIESYRRRGYSYPTISRIKKALAAKCPAQGGAAGTAQGGGRGQEAPPDAAKGGPPPPPITTQPHGGA